MKNFSAAEGGGSGTSGRTRSLARPQAQEGSSADHLSKLEALFGNSGTAGPPARLSATPQGSGRVFANARKSSGRTMSKYRMRLERLRIAREPAEIEAAANAFLDQHELPDDLDILYKLLQHPSEKVLRDAMGQISSLLIQGRISSTLILDTRLTDLTARIQEDATRQFVAGLRAQLQRLGGGTSHFSAPAPLPPTPLGCAS